MNTPHTDGDTAIIDRHEPDGRARPMQAAPVERATEITQTQLARPPSMETGPITTALLLAAGTGSRLQPLTCDAPKCLTEVNGTSILERLIGTLKTWGFKRVVVVVGYLDASIRKALHDTAGDLAVEFIYSSKYQSTNNIYSLWLARQTISEPFLLIESDLVFDTALLGDMLEPNRIAVSRRLPWMNGTTVTLDARQKVTCMHAECQPLSERSYKTVNIYSFSPQTWRRVAARLDEFVSAGRVGDYYETVFAELVSEGELSLHATVFDAHRWYEIDTLEDLHEAERLMRES